MDDFINEFKAEASSIVNNVQEYLMLLEVNKEDTSLISDIFRGIHSLKGAARMFGFSDIEQITHELENIFDEIRDGEIAVNQEIISVGLKVMDMINEILKNDDYDKTAFNELCETLKAKENLIVEESQEATEGNTVYQVIYCPNENIYERGVNPLAALEEIQEVSEAKVFTIYEPKSLEEQEQNKKFENKYEVLLRLTQSFEDLEDVFLFMDESEYQIHLIADNELSTVAAIEERVKDMLPEGEFLSSEVQQERGDFLDQLLENLENETSEAEEKLEEEEVSSNNVEEETLTVESESNNQPVKSLDSEPVNFINVKLDRLDDMMKLVSELVTIKAELSYQAQVLQTAELTNSVERLEKITTKFRDNAFSMRLVPLQILALKFQRLVRDTGNKLGKDINFITDGLDTEIDKSIINEVEAPLIHIIQNAIDHGLETPEEREQQGKPAKGLLKVVAFYSGANVFIQIQDDGRGLDLKKIKEQAISKGLIKKEDTPSDKEIIDFIFHPGFTTQNEVTHYSGRGVGLDVVANKLRQLRGSVEVTTELGLGTSFTIRLPLSLSIIDVLHVKVGSINYLIPHIEIEQCFSERVNKDLIQKQGYNLRYEGKLIPHLNLMEIFEESLGTDNTESCIIVINKNDQNMSLEVDSIVGESQLVVKPVDEALKSLSYLSGISVLGNGELAFLLDSLKLKQYYSERKASNE